MTVSEKMLWRALRALDLHVRRQAPIGRYVVDFVHHGARLVIEVDSGWHDDPEAQRRDAERDAWLAEQGYRVMRIRDGRRSVIRTSWPSASRRQFSGHPHPNPSPIKGEGL